MKCNLKTSSYADPFAAVRREFQRQIGAGTDTNFAQLSVAQTENGVILSFDLPGMSEDQITLSVENGELRLSGNRTCELPEGARQLFSNRQTGEFRRVLKLDESIDPTSIDAVLDGGVLTVCMSRREELQPKKITIRSPR